MCFFPFSRYNHSGRLGLINFLNGVMGVANAQRGLEYIRVLTEFISYVIAGIPSFLTLTLVLLGLYWRGGVSSQPEYNHVALWGFMNEAVLKTIGMDILSHL